MRHMLKSKIHRATVTNANLDYDGSITIDVNLMKEANLLEYEQVHVWNVTKGTRFCTYVIEGEASSGYIIINGAAAHLANRGDVVIIASFDILSEVEITNWDPVMVYVDDKNKIISKKTAKSVRNWQIG